MKFLRAAVFFISVFVLGGTAAQAAELWAADPATGTKICIVSNIEGLTLVSASWSGPAVGGLAEGQGKLQYVYKDKGGKETTAQADAEMKDGKLSGKASVRWSTGDFYDGYYQFGWRHGQGVYRYADGREYEGEWKNGLQEGRGAMKYANGWRYEGDWKNNLPEGNGTLKGSDGTTYQGEFKNGRPEGKGVMNFADGTVYEGDFKGSKKDGRGIQKWADGATYDGEWRDNRPEGYGTFKYSDGSTYRGEFKNGVREGQGVMADTAGKVIYEGLWKGDQPAGGAGTGSKQSASGTLKADKVLGIPWGASQDETRRIMKERPDTKYWFTNKEGKAEVQSYIGPFNNEKAGIHVAFYQDKMFQVLVSHVPTEDRLMGKFNELKGGMTHRYGPPVSESGKYLDSVATWDLGGGYEAGLRMRKNPYNQPGRPFEIQLSYWHRATYDMAYPGTGTGAGAGKDF